MLIILVYFSSASKVPKARLKFPCSLLFAAIRRLLLLFLLLVVGEEADALPPNVFGHVQQLLQLVDLVLGDLQLFRLFRIFSLTLVQRRLHPRELRAHCLWENKHMVTSRWAEKKKEKENSPSTPWSADQLLALFLLWIPLLTPAHSLGYSGSSVETQELKLRVVENIY